MLHANDESSVLARTRLAAMTLGALAASYAGLAAWYFYNDFFKFLGRGLPTAVIDSGYAVRLDCTLWTVLSPWRLAGAGVAVVLLAASSVRLWRGRPGARALALFSLWGVLLPQLLWFTEYLVDWRAGFGVTSWTVAGGAIVLIPTMLLFEGAATLRDWHPLAAHRGRVLLTAVLSTWIAFGGTELLDHAHDVASRLAYDGALAALLLGAIGAMGLMRLRTWGLLSALLAAAALGVLPTAVASGLYFPSGGTIDAFVATTSGTPLSAVVAGLVPLAAVAAVAAPLLRSAARAIRPVQHP